MTTPLVANGYHIGQHMLEDSGAVRSNELDKQTMMQIDRYKII